MIKRYKELLIAAALTASGMASAQTVVDFEDVVLAADTFYVGQDVDGASSFTSGGVDFLTSYNASWGSWSNFGVSNVQDNVTEGYSNQYAAFPNGGVNGSSNFGIATSDYSVGGAALGLGELTVIDEISVTNGTYGVLSMENGDAFGKKFGGVSGDDPDYFTVTIHGYKQGFELHDAVVVYLADFRFSDNSQDYILKDWLSVDLSSLGAVDSLFFQWSSSDDSGFGPNQPSYVFIDDITLSAVPKFAQDNGAIAYDSSAIEMWASDCVVERGYLDISDKDVELNGSNRASYGEVENAIGQAGVSSIEAISLGDSGVATLTFDREIVNGSGPDFAVFENSTIDNFLELAFVEVSSDGERFVRFPAVSRTSLMEQVGGFDTTVPDSLYNLAGKYQIGLGTPFDLEDVKDSAGLDVDAITHVRIVDAIGVLDLDLGSRDSEGNLINEPFPTPYTSAGFDLTGVGVVHAGAIINSLASNVSQNKTLYLDYATNDLYLPNTSSVNEKVTIYEAASGVEVFNSVVSSNRIALNGVIAKGVYVVVVQQESGLLTQKVVVQ